MACDLELYAIAIQLFVFNDRPFNSFLLSGRRLQMVLDEKSIQEYPVNARVPQGSILDPTLFLLYINLLPDNVICNIAIYTDDTTPYSKCYQASDLRQQLECLLKLNLIYKILWSAAGSGLLISMLEKINWFCLIGLIALI